MIPRVSSGLLPILVMICACSAVGEADSFAPTASGKANRDEAGGMDGGAASGSAGEPPAEKEIESDYEAPVSTGNVVWIANPKSGRVALVDAATLQVRTIEAGNGPTYLASVPGQNVDTTLVLNVLSEDATLLRATPTAITSATFKTARANSIAFSPDGRYAIAWADARKEKEAAKTQGFQDLAILDLIENRSTILAVGYRPVSVGFGEGRAYAVTQDGVALLDLAGGRVTKNVAISATPTEDPGTRDVFVTRDGRRAFVRRDGSNAITIVGFDDDSRADVTLTGPVTDLDLADSGDRAVAVVRSTAEVAVLPVADPANHTSLTVTGETIGSVSIAPGGNRALLFTNAIAAERFTVFDLAASATRTVRLYSPVLGIFATPDAQHAVVLHDKASPGAFSLVPIGQNLPAKIVETEAPPTAVATTNDRAVIAERDDAKKIYGAYLARLPQLMVERYPLASPPIAAGVIPSANRAFIAQQHPDGRLTFIDLTTGVARTLTGFELSARVVDGSKP